MPIFSDREIVDEIPLGLQPDDVEHIAIIGGGASGAIALDCLLQEKPSNFKKIDVFERRDQLGGVWVLDENIDKSLDSKVKSGSSNYDLDPQLANPFEYSNSKLIVNSTDCQERFEQTASYKTLTTNIPETIMTYSDKKKWSSSQNQDRDFVDGSVVNEYINQYFHKNLLDPRISLNLSTSVEDVERIPNYKPGPQNLKNRFRLTLRRKLNDSQDIWWQQDCDSIIVATGHYHIPRIPWVQGLCEIEKIPDVIHHGKFYRNNERYKNKTVVVVGSRASAIDIINEVCKTALKVYQSKTNNSNLPNFDKSKVETKPKINSYEVTSEGFRINFDDNTFIDNPDHIIYATGYLFSYPFLNRLTNNSIVDNGIVSNLYQHIFPIDEQLITFVGIPIDGISFRVFEYQAILISRYLSGKIQLPSKSQKLQWLNKRLTDKGYTRAYHTIGVEDAVEYMDTLTKLGTIINNKINQGRQFPIFSNEEFQEYVQSKEILLRKWFN